MSNDASASSMQVEYAPLVFQAANLLQSCAGRQYALPADKQPGTSRVTLNECQRLCTREPACGSLAFHRSLQRCKLQKDCYGGLRAVSYTHLTLPTKA